MTVPTLLFVHCNPNPVASMSLSAARAFLEAYRKAAPDDQITELDLYENRPPYIDAEVFSGWGKLAQGEQLTEGELQKVNSLGALADQFAGADRYVFATPFWNFSYPPLMKAYIDAICVAGKTFKYTEAGPVGLLKGHRAVHVQARGGVYNEGPAAALEMGDRHLRVVMQFLGVEMADTVVIEGHAQFPDRAGEILAQAKERAAEAGRNFASLPVGAGA